MIPVTVYTCPQHGDVWRVELVDDIDTDNDEISNHLACAICGSEVREKRINGITVVTEIEPDTDNEEFLEDEY